MAKLNGTLLGAALMAATVINPALAHERSAELAGSTPLPAVELEAVDRIQTWGRLDDFRALDRQTLIVWATPFKPYLVKLSWPSPDLNFAQAIGVTSTAGAVTRFDSILVDGRRYPIDAMYRLDRDQAKALQTSRS